MIPAATQPPTKAHTSPTARVENLLAKRDGLASPMLKALALAEAKRWLRELSSEEVLKLTAAATDRVVRGKGQPALKLTAPTAPQAAFQTDSSHSPTPGIGPPSSSLVTRTETLERPAVSDPLLDLNEAESVDKLCDQFEDALRKGEHPRLDDWLTRAGPNATGAIPDLAALEFHYRIAAGEAVIAADYFARYPALWADLEAAVRLVAIEYRAALALDSGLTEEVFRRRYPELAIAQEWSNGPWVGKVGVAGGGTVAHTPPSGGYGVAFGPTPPPPEPNDDLHGLLAPPDRPGDLGRFGNYHILGLLGRGGMGMVLRAEDATLHRPVALKLMLPKIARQQHARERFLREARAAARVDHPRVVPIRHVGEVGEMPFIDMPLLQGQSLGTRLRAGSPLTPAEVIRFAREAAEGLAAAHATGLIHRDVKPDNTWLEDRDGEVHVKLLDFGLARGGEIEMVTQPGVMVGTPAYMSPEQTRGKEVDARSDLFSLGVVVYEMASRRLPFAGADIYALLSAIALDTPPPLTEVAPAMPHVLSVLVVRLLAKEPTGRPKTATEVATELGQIETSLGSHTSTILQISEQKIRFSRRRWVWAAGVAVVALTGVGLWNSKRPGDIPKPIEPLPINSNFIPPSEAVRVKGMAVRHYAKVGEGVGESRGLLGETSFGAVLGDQVTIEVELSRPAYAYVVAFRPDGVIEPIFPENPVEPPPLTDRPRYPSISLGVNYGLTDGAGLWVFAVVVSDRALPPYSETFAGKSTVWKKEVSPIRTVWWYDGQWVEGLSPRGKESREERGAGVTVPGKSAVVRATEWLKAEARADAAVAIGFRVDERN